MLRKTCPNCHSENLIPNVDVVAGDQLAIRIYERPDVTLRQERLYALKAWVCADCGYTQFFVAQTEELAKSYKRFLGHA